MSNLIRVAFETATSAQNRLSEIYNSDFVPSSDNTFDLGSEDNQFKNLYLHGFLMTNSITTPIHTDLNIIPDTGITNIQSQLTYRSNLIEVSSSISTEIVQSNSVFLIKNITEAITISITSHCLDSIANGTVCKFIVSDNITSDIVITFTLLQSQLSHDKFKGKFNSAISNAIYIDPIGALSMTINTNGLKTGDVIEMIYIGSDNWIVNGNIYDSSQVTFVYE